MKQINVYFDDDDYKELIKVKNGLTWHKFILTLIQSKGGSKNDSRNKI